MCQHWFGPIIYYVLGTSPTLETLWFPLLFASKTTPKRMTERVPSKNLKKLASVTKKTPQHGWPCSRQMLKKRSNQLWFASLWDSWCSAWIQTPKMSSQGAPKDSKITPLGLILLDFITWNTSWKTPQTKENRSSWLHFFVQGWLSVGASMS
jgi:hypothetical protein